MSTYSNVRNLTKDQRKFPSLYKKLSIEQQDLLKMLSVIYEQVSRTKVCSCMKRAGIRSKKGGVYTNSQLNLVIKALGKNGLVHCDTKGVRCEREIVELVTRKAVEDNSFEKMAWAIKTELKAQQAWSMETRFRSYDQGVRDVRIAIYRGKSCDIVQKLLSEVYQQHGKDFQKNRPYQLIFCNPLDKDLLANLEPALLNDVMEDLLLCSLFILKPVDEEYAFLQEYCASTSNASDELIDHLLLQDILRGKHDAVRTLLAEKRKYKAHLAKQGMLSFIHGETQEALKAYRQWIKYRGNSPGQQELVYNSIAGLFYPLALMQSGKPIDLQEAVIYLKTAKKQPYSALQHSLDDILQTVYLTLGLKKQAHAITHSSEQDGYSNYLNVFISYLTLYWQDKTLLAENPAYLIQLLNGSQKTGHLWLARETASLLIRFDVEATTCRKLLVTLNKTCSPCPCLVENITRVETWERALNSLIGLQAVPQQTTKIQQDSRVIWLLEYYGDSDEYDIYPKLQKLSKSGKWTKGRAVALKTLAKNPESLDCLSSQDRLVTVAINKSYVGGRHYYSYGNESYELDLLKAFKALVGHPLLFRHDNPGVNIELTMGQPEIHIEQVSRGFRISITPTIDEELGYTLFEETPTRLKLVVLSDEYQQISEILDSPIEVPKKAKAMVLDALAAVAPMLTVHSDIAGALKNIKEVEADDRLFLHLLPAGDGLKVEFFQKPFRDSGSFYPPGSGGKMVMAEIDGQQFQCNRDLQKERKKADAVIELCSVLKRLETVNYAYLLEEPEECLELLSDLQPLGEMIDIQWPQGESLRVSSILSAEQFSLRVKRENEWFAASGTLKVDDNMVIDMKKLLELSRLSESRFIKLQDGQFLALTSEFKRRLDEIRSFGEKSKDGVQLNPLAALALEDFTKEVGSFKADKYWKNNIKRFEPIDPQLPSTLQAELRDYQQEGFNWLACLSEWQVGACLADDMGLGKTVQALAAVLLRAPKGPTLVIAPTSVMMNWQDEATRFAPTLNILWFGGANRQAMLDNLASFDLMICSYGLLQVEGEKLAAVKWQTIILDEAQAIKNMATKRSKAAMNLQGQFRIITTGTPIENHLGELWNLFNFINPGLLGTIESFNHKFALPIEKMKDKGARSSLKKLIQPFILRRLKRDVLQELPPRTEVTMQVEMSEDEAAMYEAQRSLALEKLADNDAEKPGGKQMQIFAEITRLRRFCCNPNLVLPKAGIASSKLKVFGQIISELLENKHKALVFSQFVGHLDLIKAHLQEKNIRFQYLDGSTTVKQRQKRVNDFQAGEGDVFLISLKAGGSGLNLTAADYVIHMDPWWNPAVEDQASDRAHRIGQQRPVTVYRLVVKNTIEEKIVAMHKHKRDLADNLLGGSDMSGRISTDELLSLLKKS